MQQVTTPWDAWHEKAALLEAQASGYAGAHFDSHLIRIAWSLAMILDYMEG